jgi:iron complex transport system substrate-binding protein
MEKAGVPVLITEGSDASRNLDRMREDFTMIAQAVGKEDEAEEVLADLDESFAETRDSIAEAGNEGVSFAMADGWMEGSNVSIRMFAEGALFSDVAEEVGLENAWTVEGDPMWGLGTTDVEGISSLKKHEDLVFLYSSSEEPDVFAEGLSENAIWTSMPFVEKGNLHKLEDGTWTFGGPASIEFFLDQLDEVFGR